MVENTTAHSVLAEWLSIVAPHLDLDSCIFSDIATLRASRCKDLTLQGILVSS